MNLDFLVAFWLVCFGFGFGGVGCSRGRWRGMGDGGAIGGSTSESVIREATLL